MNITFRNAEVSEYTRVRDFYYTLIDESKNREYNSKWKKGIYPEDAYLRSAIENGELRLAFDGEDIVGAMIINHTANMGYAQVQWPSGASKAEALVIHVLGVAVRASGKGVGRQMVNEVIRLAKLQGHKAVRLDVMAENLPAVKLYRGAGFQYVTSMQLFYEDTGWYNFDIYEYVIDPAEAGSPL